MYLKKQGSGFRVNSRKRPCCGPVRGSIHKTTKPNPEQKQTTVLPVPKQISSRSQGYTKTPPPPPKNGNNQHDFPAQGPRKRPNALELSAPICNTLQILRPFHSPEAEWLPSLAPGEISVRMYTLESIVGVYRSCPFMAAQWLYGDGATSIPGLFFSTSWTLKP